MSVTLRRAVTRGANGALQTRNRRLVAEGISGHPSHWSFRCTASGTRQQAGADGCVRLLRGFDVNLLVRRHAQAGEIGQAEMQELGLLLRGEGDGLASVDIDRGERAQRLTVDRA